MSFMNPVRRLKAMITAESHPASGPASVIGESAIMGISQALAPPSSMAEAVPKLRASRSVQRPVAQNPLKAKMVRSARRLHRGSLRAASWDILTGVDLWLSTEGS